MKIDENMLILAQDHYYSMDCHKTFLNNNVLVVGASGAGKTRSIVEPNILQAFGSYVISDPKGRLYGKYRKYLESKGYKVLKLDFTDPPHSDHYNFFRYINNRVDIIKISHMLIYQDPKTSHIDPFWDQTAQLLVQACVAYLCETEPPEKQRFEQIMRLLSLFDIDENLISAPNQLDKLMNKLEERDKNSYAVSTYKKFRVAAARTLKSIMITVYARLGFYDVSEINEMLGSNSFKIPSIGMKKTALFVIVSDTDRSMDGLANIFFSQCMSELCRYADKSCKDGCLPVPVRFILDDFATNVRINEFPRMISTIRSRGISTMLMVQAEGQLAEAYGDDAGTIVANCDNYVFLGTNDVESARSVAERCDVPLKKALYMPVGTNIIFRRGQEPVIYAKNFDLCAFEKQKMGRTDKENQERGLDG